MIPYPIPQIVFLEYLSRSGSTLLANRLDRFEGVYCTLELDLPHFLLNPPRNSPAPLPRFHMHNIHRVIGEIWADPKIKTWPFSGSDLIVELEGLGQEYFSVIDIIQGLAVCIRKISPGSRVVIFKGLLKNPEIFSQLRLPHAQTKLLGILRDPRAVFSSQLLAKRYDSNLPLGLNRQGFVRNWKQFSNFFGSRNHQDIHLCRYEDFIANEKEIVTEILHWLAISPVPSKDGPHYCDKIPLAQTHLHENVGQGVLKAPLTAWKDKLPPPAWKYIQKELAAMMGAHGYPQEPCPPVSPWEELTYRGKENWMTLRYRINRLKKVLTKSGNPKIIPSAD